MGQGVGGKGERGEGGKEGRGKDRQTRVTWTDRKKELEGKMDRKQRLGQAEGSKKRKRDLTINNQRLIDLDELFVCELKVSEVATLTGLSTVMTMNPTSLFNYNIQCLKKFFSP